MLGAIAGIDSFSGLADYAQAHEENLKKVLSLPTGTPSHDTLQRLFDNLTSVPLLLELLELSGRIVTLDAMGCQREIAQQIIDQGGDYVIALKRNQKTLWEDVTAYFDRRADYPFWQEVDKGHGRFEERSCYATDTIDWLKEQHAWSGLHSIAKVISKRLVKGQETQEVRYYLSSLAAEPERICRAARTHWAVENKLHWRLDVVFNEDKCCIRNDNAAENRDMMRKWALNILSQQKGSHSMKSLQRKASMSFKFMLELLQNTFHA